MLILAYEKRMKHNAMFDSKKIQRKEKKNVEGKLMLSYLVSSNIIKIS